MLPIFKQIDFQTAVDFLLPKHYSGRKPTVSVAFGAYIGEELKAVCTFGKPASYTLCNGVCGKEYSSDVYELNRLCRTEDYEFPLSQFVGYCLRQLKDRDWIIISYSDTAMNHHGYVYQACNFLYTGHTQERTDPYNPNGHHRHTECKKGAVRVVRSAKHRYIYFCTHHKRIKKQWLNALKYKVQPYPKGDNRNYILGEYIKPIIVTNE